MLRSYSDIMQSRVQWLWFPYIAFGKLTVLQGNPGEGKSKVGIQIAATLSSGGFLPDGTRFSEPLKVIYQCAEDGLADTIKPRLVQSGANCNNVAFIDNDFLKLDDEELRQSIEEYKAKLLIIDPFQAYLGSSDISSASGIRRILSRLSRWANLYDCAVLLIGHLNKNEGAKDLYRGLGSIDVTAAARSVLQLESSEEDPDVKVIKQVKNSLATKGKDVHFSITPEHGIQWIKAEEIEANQNQKETFVVDTNRKKQEIVADSLKQMLSDGPQKTGDIYKYFLSRDVGERTLNTVKKDLKIESVRKDGQWYWVLNTKEKE